MPFSYTHFYPNLLLEVPKLPELWSLESSSSFRIRDYEDSNKGRRICFYFLFEICPTKTASWRTLKFGQWFLQKLEKGSSEYFLLFHYFQLLSLFPEYTHPPPLIFLWKGATCLRLKKEHSYTNCFTKAKLDFGSLKKILEEPMAFAFKPNGHILNSKGQLNPSAKVYAPVPCAFERFSFVLKILFIYLTALGLSCHMPSCSIWDLVPWSRLESRPLQWEYRVPATELPGKSLKWSFKIIFLCLVSSVRSENL